ncbi:alpha/beta-hydrolase [Agrocybe pediades]|nr:alpha/beta-hydrolase [Agrocybe pediades]
MSQPKTLEYKRLSETHPVFLDVYSPPLPATTEPVLLPIVMFFHGGALTLGNRTSFFAHWLKDRVLAMGYAFVSADYRLLIPTTAQEIVEDLQDAFKFVVENELPGDGYVFRLDGDRIAVTGSSAGGHCARLAVIHCKPRPKVLVDIYSSGGNLFTEFHAGIKPGEIKFVGQTIPHLEDAPFKSLTYPYSDGIPEVITDMEVDPSKITNPNDPRLNIYCYHLQQGQFLDYYAGLHEPSMCASFRTILSTTENPTEEDFRRVIPEEKHGLFPQLCVDANWPPTILIHGVVDDVVPIEESRHFYNLIKTRSKAPVKLMEVEGAGGMHLFDIFPGAEEVHKAEFDAIADFIKGYL